MLALKNISPLHKPIETGKIWQKLNNNNNIKVFLKIAYALHARDQKSVRYLTVSIYKDPRKFAVGNIFLQKWRILDFPSAFKEWLTVTRIIDHFVLLKRVPKEVRWTVLQKCFLQNSLFNGNAMLSKIRWLQIYMYQVPRMVYFEFCIYEM